jgi:ABC-2 type transport system permease protein
VSTVTHSEERRYGPNAFGDDLRRFVNLTVTLANTDFKLTYFGSALGYLWTLVRPLLFFGVLLVVFTKIFHLGAHIPHYSVTLLGAIIFWTFFVQVTTACVQCMLAREGLLRKMRFPRLVIPLAVALTAFYQFVLNMIPVFLFAIVSGVYPRLSWLELPVLMLLLTTLACGLGMVLSVLYVRMRDIQPIWDVTSQILFYATPIIYPALAYGGAVPLPPAFPSLAGANPLERHDALFHPSAYGAIHTLGHILMCSPLAAIMTQMRKALVGGSNLYEPSAAFAIGGAVRLLIPLGLILLAFGFGVLLFTREAPRIAENL